MSTRSLGDVEASWAIAASIPPPFMWPSRRPPSAPPPVLWINCSNPPRVSVPNADERANSGVGRHLSTTRPRLPPGTSFAPVSASSDAGHRDLPHGGVGRFARMVRPLPIHAYRLPLLPQPPLSQVSRLGS